jgi:MarR family transcriptional regulator, negative regulator of the multidrug operon emrRAB
MGQKVRNEPSDPRLVNILAAFAVALADGIREATEAAAGMTGAAPAALVALDQFLAGCPTEDLAQVMGLTHSGAVRLVDRLVDAGLVERRAGRDARSGSIVLTARGRELSRHVTRARALAVEAVLESLGGDDSRGLVGLVETLVGNITTVRLGTPAPRDEPRGWMCRLCDLESCGRPRGECPAANVAQAHARH